MGNNQFVGIQQRNGRLTMCRVVHLIRLENFISKAFIRKEYVATVFFDLEKAMKISGNMRDLYDLGLKVRVLEFIKNFIPNRTFQVHTGSILSD